MPMEFTAFSPNKIQPPRQRTGLVARPDLERRIGEALLRQRLVVLCAPAGYGKTVALVRQLAQLPAATAVAWVTCDRDDDLSRFLACLTAALEPYDLPWRVAPEALDDLARRDGGLQQVAGAVARALESAEAPRGLIVLDDMHACADPRVFTLLDMLLRLMPSNWTVAIASRTRPPLALGRLLVSGELAEFGQGDLSFNEQEVELLMQVQGLPGADDSATLAHELYQRTQGWIAGVRLSLQASAPMGGMDSRGRLGRRRLFDYLASEVFEQMPQEMQQFLLNCSVLPVLTAERCLAVSANARAAALLEEIEELGLFVQVLDGDELSLRLHDLFREFLEERLLREQPGELKPLLVRAADSEPDVVARVGYLLQAGMYGEAATQLSNATVSRIRTGTSDRLLRLIDQFPAEFRDQSPDLEFTRGLCAWNSFGFATMGRAMRAAAEGFERQERWQLALKARALGSWALNFLAQLEQASSFWAGATLVEMEPSTELLVELNAFVRSTMEGPYSDSPKHLDRVVQLLSDDPEARNWMSLAITLDTFLGRIGLRGPCERMLDLLTASMEEDESLLKARVLCLRAWMHLWRAEFSAALELIAEAELHAQWTGNLVALVIPIQHFRSVYAALTGDAQAMQRDLGGIAASAARSAERRSASLYMSAVGAYAITAEDWDMARSALSFLQGDPHTDQWPFARHSAQVIRAVLQLRDSGAAQNALSVLREIGPHAADWDWWGLHARVRVTWARAELRCGHVDLAWQALEPALRAARESGEILGLLTCGPGALSELAATSWPAHAVAADTALIKACAAQALALRESKSEDLVGTPHAEQLSHREMEVLSLVAKGQSNKHIARALGLSPHTVKRHVARILAKTDKSSRVQAAAWLRACAGADP
jgi:LuxR family maltose regulon positive regulatory protein